MTCHMIPHAAEQGLVQLLDLNPYDVKRLLHLIFSRKEFTVSESEPLSLSLSLCPTYGHSPRSGERLHASGRPAADHA